MEDKIKSILVTGGAGFIGSHTCLKLLESNFTIFILDSNINSSKLSIDRIINIGKKNNLEFEKKIFFFKGDIRDEIFLNNVFLKAIEMKKKIKAVIHFAGLKSVRESVINPILYWDFNVNGSLKLFATMKKYNCKTIVFSSSATVYGSREINLREDLDLKPANPYGETKVAIERILKNIFISEKKSWRIVNLRYFNPIGAHPSGKIGENPLGIPNNIFPKLIDVAARKIDKLQIFGNDWDTPDGTGIRDYIHVMDLAEGHVSALDYMFNQKSLFLNLNLGTGKGYSVLELIRTFSEVNDVDIPFEFAPKRKGDVARLVADNRLSLSILNWRPIHNLEDMCRDGWNWQKNK